MLRRRAKASGVDLCASFASSLQRWHWPSHRAPSRRRAACRTGNDLRHHEWRPFWPRAFSWLAGIFRPGDDQAGFAKGGILHGRVSFSPLTFCLNEALRAVSLPYSSRRREEEWQSCVTIGRSGEHYPERAAARDVARYQTPAPRNQGGCGISSALTLPSRSCRLSGTSIPRHPISTQ